MQVEFILVAGEESHYRTEGCVGLAIGQELDKLVERKGADMKIELSALVPHSIPQHCTFAENLIAPALADEGSLIGVKLQP